MKLVGSALLYCVIVFAAGFILGTCRVLWVVPRLGVRTAELLELPIMLAVSYVTARWMHVHRLKGCGQSTALGVGAMALVFLLAAEIALAVTLRGGSIRAALAGRDPVSGAGFYVSLLAFMLMPWWVGRSSASTTGTEELGKQGPA